MTQTMTQGVKSILLPLAVLSSLWTSSCVRDETKPAAEVKPATLQKVQTGLKPGVPTAHTTRVVEGWTVRVDDRLLKGEHAATGEQALKLLNAKLVAMTAIMPEKALVSLRKIDIELDLDYADLRSMQYHPGAGWLKSNGYSETVAKCAHIPNAVDFLSPYENHRMPWVVLHELAHGYHDQVLGFDEPRVKAAWTKFRDSGKYKSILTNSWGMAEHYGMSNQMEFFAEMTESYWGSNDFYPFVPGELKQVEPEIFALMEEIWGPLPQSKPRRAKDAILK
jgi:hypothetical protein